MINESGPARGANRWAGHPPERGAHVHYRTAKSGPDPAGSEQSWASARGVTTMLLTIAVLVAGGALILYKVRAAARAKPADLGWMSAQWLAEYRASHPT